jgi:RimJ/RimL family protein N-acetyltransferase
MPDAIILRPVAASDLPVFFEQQLNPAATEMAAFPARAREAFFAHWAKIMAGETNVVRTVLCDGQVAGNMQSFVLDGQREVGYWIGRKFWGQGIATAALRLFLQELKERPLYAHVAKHNIASRRVLEKCGFRLLREDNGYSLEPDGPPLPEYILLLDDPQPGGQITGATR